MVIVLTPAILIACSGGGTENTTNAPTIPASTRASTASSSPPSPATPSLQATAAATATLAAAPAAAVPPTAYPVRTDNGIIGEDFIAKCSASYSQPGVLRTANQCQ